MQNKKCEVRNSASLRSLPCLRLGHLTADKRLCYTSPKLPSATSFIRETLYEIPNYAFRRNFIQIQV